MKRNKTKTKNKIKQKSCTLWGKGLRWQKSQCRWQSTLHRATTRERDTRPRSPSCLWATRLPRRCPIPWTDADFSRRVREGSSCVASTSVSTRASSVLSTNTTEAAPRRTSLGNSCGNARTSTCGAANAIQDYFHERFALESRSGRTTKSVERKRTRFASCYQRRNRGTVSASLRTSERTPWGCSRAPSALRRVRNLCANATARINK